MLPDKALAPYYGKVTWLYVCRTFKDEPRDVEARRDHDRLGVSSWPQMFVFDPSTEAVLGTPPRHKAGFIATFDKVLAGWQGAPRGAAVAAAMRDLRAKLKGDGRDAAVAALQERAQQRDGFEGWLEARELLVQAGVRSRPALPDRLADPDPLERVVALEELAAAGAAPGDAVLAAVRRLLSEERGDKVVRIRALQVLRRHAPDRVPDEVAIELLRLPNDPLRYEVLDWLRENPRAVHTATLLDLMENVGERYASYNPNVVRIRAVQCLGACGDARCVAPLLAMLRTGSLYNGLTGQVPGALAGVAARLAPDARRALAREMAGTLPTAVAAGADGKPPREERLALAKVRVTVAALAKISGRRMPPVPATWRAADRAQLVGELDAALPR